MNFFRQDYRIDRNLFCHEKSQKSQKNIATDFTDFRIRISHKDTKT